MDKSGACKVIKSLTLALLRETEMEKKLQLNTENTVRIFGGGEWERGVKRHEREI